MSADFIQVLSALQYHHSPIDWFLLQLSGRRGTALMPVWHTIKYFTIYKMLSLYEWEKSQGIVTANWFY